MKLLIASDIHGDADCCKKMLSAADMLGVEKILLLGDILYHGPRNDIPEGYAPKQVINMLNAVADRLICVRGNCEAEVDGMVLSFPVLCEHAWIYDSQSKISMYMTHGHIYNPDRLPPLSARNVLLYGHTHLQGFCERNGILCLNPGSISLPKGGNPKTYATYEDGIFSIYTLDGELLSSRSL